MTSVPRLAMKRNDTRKYTAAAWVRGYGAWLLVLPLYLSLWLFATLFKKLPDSITRKLLLAHDRYTATHKMDFRIPPNEDVSAYMLRWWRIARNAYFNIYFHIVLRGDDDRALHDHPWWNFSIVLDGGYWEHTISEGGVHRKIWYGPGSVRFRRAGTFAHRLELKCDRDGFGDPCGELPVKTIFITGPVLRRWGFHHPDQWVDAYDWDKFNLERGEKNFMPMEGGSDAVQSDRNKL